MMTLKEFLQENIVLLDGSMGTMLQRAGLPAGIRPAEWNLDRPEEVRKVHRAYFDAGTNVVCTNTFGVTAFTYDDQKLEMIVRAAIENARAAAAESTGKQPKFVSLDLGPSGKMLQPYGDTAFEEMVAVFAENVRLGVRYGVDAVSIETMNDSYETKAALLAVKENSDLPVFVTNSYGSDGKLMTGADPMAMIALLEGMGADAIGMNCSLGPKELMPTAEEYLKYASIPVILKPNAGMPKIENGETVYDIDAREFADTVAEAVQKGVRLAGGCCGTTPEYIRALAEKLRMISPVPVTDKHLSLVSSYTHAVVFGRKDEETEPVLIGERINPTGRKLLREAIGAGNIAPVLSEAVQQQEQGARVLDVNAGVPGTDERETLPLLVREIQTVTDLPLQIDTGNAEALEAGLRLYNGKALINSVNGKEESMAAVFPLARKYGAMIVALPLDENGIPADAGGRVAIAEKILQRAAQYGITANNIIFDPLVMTVSTDIKAAAVTLETLHRIRKELGCLTTLGISNVSFGLPERPVLNSTFLHMAREAGLDAAIFNPGADRSIDDEIARRTLSGQDEGCSAYMQHIGEIKAKVNGETAKASVTPAGSGEILTLRNAIRRGLKQQAASLTAQHSPDTALALIQEEIIPALNEVGEAFGAGRIFLPQLLMSAEAAGEALQIVRSMLPAGQSKSGMKILLATVKGDIHDIGKNICRLLLESYGYSVIDLGKDVPAERVLEAITPDVKIVGLSALMTTTLPAMEETVRAVRKHFPSVDVVVGGAVLTEDYAASIGADYSRDAMAMVRYAQRKM